MPLKPISLSGFMRPSRYPSGNASPQWVLLTPPPQKPITFGLPQMSWMTRSATKSGDLKKAEAQLRCVVMW